MLLHVKTFAQVELSYRELCSRDYKVEDFRNLEKKVVFSLCWLEIIFPPSFFDVIVRLAYVPKEASICRAVNINGYTFSKVYIHSYYLFFLTSQLTSGLCKSHTIIF